MSSEAISEHLISKNFLGEHAPRPPGYVYAHAKLHIHVNPLLKILATGLPHAYILCSITSVRCTLHIKMYRNMYQEEDVHNNINSIIIIFFLVCLKNFMSHRQGIHVNSKLLIQDVLPSPPPQKIVIVTTTDRLDKTELQRQWVV